MNYQQTVNWLFNQLPVYQNEGIFKYKVDLQSITKVCDQLNNPQNNFKSIHVAGTNGKGSSSHMLSSVFQEAGLKVGLYTSPHLVDFRERIKLNGSKVEKKFVVDFIDSNIEFFSNNKISFFEMTVAMAFDFFSKSKVDIAIIETGLGGRLDATNIINPLISLITNIGLDHKEFLGESLIEIAREKAGIIKPGIPIVISEFQNEIFQLFEERAKELNSAIYISDHQKKLKTDLLGNFQNKNINGVLKVISLLKEFNISNKSINRGFLNVKKNTGLIGRFQILSKSPMVICDVGHNLEAFNEICKELESIRYQNLKLVLGFVQGKNFNKILDLLPKSAEYYFCSPNLSRALDIKELKNYSIDKGINSTFHKSVKEAYKCALQNCNKNDLLFIGGSNFTVAEIL